MDMTDTLVTAEVEQTVPNFYRIPTENYPGFLVAIEKLSKRAVKLGCPIIVPQVIGESHETNKAGAIVTTFLHVVVDAEPVKLAGWTFLASLDHSNENGTILRVSPTATAEVPAQYRNCVPHCDHCDARRRRRDTFLLHKAETGEVAQIGRNCIRDFLGQDPQRLAASAQYLFDAADAAADAESEGWGGGSVRQTMPVSEFLVHCAAMVRLHGWVSRKVSQETDGRLMATSMLALTNLFPYSREEKAAAIRPEPEDREIAQAAMDWALSLGEKDNLSDYEHNILVLAQNRTVECRSAGLVASIVGCYVRNTEAEQRRRAERASHRPSEFVGTIGERLKGVRAKVISIWAKTGDFGTFYITRFITEDGDVFVWKNTSSTKIEQDATYDITGTIVSHDTYTGKDGYEQKSTKLSRCKVTLVEEVALAA